MGNNLTIAGDSPSSVIQLMQQILNAIPGLIYVQAIVGLLVVFFLARGVYNAAVNKNAKLVYMELAFGGLALLEVFDPLFLPNILANVLLLIKL